MTDGPAAPARRPRLDPGEEPLNSMNEKSMARHLWWRVGYFLIAIHVIAFVMMYAAEHAPKK
ncbi:hypothetical protein ACFQLX_05245 [Streptomyces polyrhachis]|uniref:Small hydrophobic protein n=1 Tax=Streptomyces polyrhachis TaxID=1282885 RepID=A0ABW2GAL0_9ACTN